MDQASESIVFGLTWGVGAGLVVGLFTGLVITCVLAGAICGILLGSFVDLPALLGKGGSTGNAGRYDADLRGRAAFRGSGARRGEAHGPTAASRGGREWWGREG